jgi:hypothetical protein
VDVESWSTAVPPAASSDSGSDTLSRVGATQRGVGVAAIAVDNRKFAYTKLVGGHTTIAGYDLTRCDFEACVLAQFDDPDFGLVVRDVTATRCAVRRTPVHGVYFDTVTISHLRTASLQPAACVFRHVVLAGRIGNLMLVPPNPSIPAQMQASFAARIVQLYAEVDWALDISAAEFTGADLYYLPGHLIRRDEETQFLLHRERLHDVDLDSLPTFARIAVSRFDAVPFASIVAIAARRGTHFREQLSAFQELRRRGIAE